MSSLRSNLLLQPDKDNADSSRLVMGAHMQAFRQTRNTIQLLVYDPIKKRQKVYCIHGRNLHNAWTDLIFNRTHELIAKTWLDLPTLTGVDKITEWLEWQKPAGLMNCDPCKVRSDCYQIETFNFRDLWHWSALESFVLHPRNKKLCLQFKNNHAYILTPRPELYPKLRDLILQAKFSPGCLNKFTMYGDTKYPVGADTARYRFYDITYHRKDIVAEAGWECFDLIDPAERLFRRHISREVEM